MLKINRTGLLLNHEQLQYDVGNHKLVVAFHLTHELLLLKVLPQDSS